MLQACPTGRRPRGRPGHAGEIIPLGWPENARQAGGGGWSEGGLGFSAETGYPALIKERWMLRIFLRPSYFAYVPSREHKTSITAFTEF